jgi:peptide/nickel transport system substrate-binding protein
MISLSRGWMAVGLAGIVAGCGSGDSGNKQQAGVVTSEAGRKPEQSSKKGGYLVIPSAEPALINPVLQNAFDLAHPLIFEGLVGLDSSFELVGALAQSWDRAADGTKLTFHLRKNVTWHDGKPFTSADVAFTVDAIRKAQTSIWRNYLAGIDKVETPDPLTVVVTYTKPNALDLASFTFGVLPAHQFDKGVTKEAAANRSPVGTGPFKFVRWNAGKDMILDANATYWGGRPNVDQLQLVFDIQPSQQLKALRASPGRLDFVEIVVTEEWTGEVQTPEFREFFETGTLDESRVAVIAWNNQKKPFDDRRVRMGLAHALDRARIIEDVLRGSARPASSPFYPTMWGADPGIAPWPFDRAKAAAFFDEAKLPKVGNKPRFVVELLVDRERRGSVYDEMLAIFRDDLDKVGVELKVTYLPRNELVDRLILHTFDAALFEWGPDIPDPDPYVLLHSTQVDAGANYAGYTNPDVDRLLEEARSTNDRAKRKESYHAIHKVIHEEQPYTFLYTPQSHYAWSRRLRGVNPIDVSSLPRQPGVSRWSVDR